MWGQAFWPAFFAANDAAQKAGGRLKAWPHIDWLERAIQAFSAANAHEFQIS
jgi:hypothetical protein